MYFQAMLRIIQRLFWAAPLLLIMSCEPGNSARQSNSADNIKQRHAQQSKIIDPGQTDPNADLLQGNHDDFSLKARRLRSTDTMSNSQWVVELFKGSKRLGNSFSHGKTIGGDDTLRGELAKICLHESCKAQACLTQVRN